MRTRAAMFNEIGAALQFPDYFGENGAALDECLTDLSWLPAERYVIVVTDAADVLADESLDALHGLSAALLRAAETWAEPIARGESWDRPAIPFHVVLQARPNDREAVVDRWGEPIAGFTE